MLVASCSASWVPTAPHLCNRVARPGAGWGEPGVPLPLEEAWRLAASAPTICHRLTRVFCSALVPSVTGKGNVLTSAQFPELIIFFLFPFWRLTTYVCVRESETDRQTDREGGGGTFPFFQPFPNPRLWVTSGKSCRELFWADTPSGKGEACTLPAAFKHLTSDTYLTLFYRLRHVSQRSEYPNLYFIDIKNPPWERILLLLSGGGG